MTRLFVVGLALALTPLVLLAAEPVPQPAFDGAEGFGAVSRGGSGGTVLRVTSLADDPAQPEKGTLRWAVQEKGPRIVCFDVAGNIRLQAPLRVTEPFLTIDGSGAPAGGVCLCDHSLMIKGTRDIVVRHVRLRHGDLATLQSVRAAGLERPKGSAGLDGVSLDDSQNILFDHCSLSWCCDELFGIVRCREVTIQWCLLAEPLANPTIHPYGDRHAYGVNASANRLTIHHCLFAHYVMRGPQFEANDVRLGLGYDIEMEAVNNVLFDYERSGTRYTTGIEDHPEEAAGTQFRFQFLNNYYINRDASQPMIEAVLKHGVIKPLEVFIKGNIGPQRPADDRSQLAGVFADLKTPIAQAQPDVQAQLASQRLVTPPIPVSMEQAERAYERVLAQAGAFPRDAVDRRIIDNVRQRRFGRIVKSQDEVGGWPDLTVPPR